MSGSVISDFFTGFQFLTRIQIVEQTTWSPDALGRSVKFFPLVGCSIGLILAGSVYLVQNLLGLKIPVHTLAALIIICEIIITGGLHCDGFMDTADGIFSGRSPERMLEIMKDSRVGAFGVIGFCLLILGKFSLLLDLEAAALPAALITMPVVGRMAGVVAITLFPYARTDGLGKMFYQYTDKRDLYMASILTLLVLATLGNTAVIAGAGGMIAAFGMANYISRRLGGLTGDTYGAIIEVTEVIVLAIFVGRLAG